MYVIDFEVFKHDWLCCILNLKTKKITTIINNKNKLEKFYEKTKQDVLIGYNIKNYDQYIFKAILCGFDPKEVNDFIILKGNDGYRYSSQFNKISLNFFDVMMRGDGGLKSLEGFMGNDIKETSVPFDIDRKLNDKELEEVVYYCTHDVEQTAIVFYERIEEFTSQLELVSTFDLPKSYLGKTKAQLTACILGAVQSDLGDDELDYTILNNLKINKYSHIVDWFKNALEDAKKEHIENASFSVQCVEMQREDFLKTFYSRNLELNVAGVPHSFGWGGLHGAIPNYHGKGVFINVDVALN